MLPIDAQVLRAIAPRANGSAARRQADIIDAAGAVLQQTLERYDISTRLRIAHFLAQICHESDGFRTTEEYADGWAYEGREDLGNIQQGDGPRYKGRGLLQLTGRANYRDYGAALGIDLENDPDRAADPALSLAVACEYWKRNNLNVAADNNDLEAATRRVNGGLNGLESRRQYLNAALAELARIEQLIRHGQEPDSRPVLALGSRGDAVGQLQAVLKQWGFDIAIDQDFGPATELAVKTFQSGHGLKSDGIVGAITWDALGKQGRAPRRSQPTMARSQPLRYWPLEKGWEVYSEYGPRWGTVHEGMDFGWPGGSANKPVYAVQSGKVIYAGQAQGYGGPDPAGWLVIDSNDEEGGGCLEYGHIVREVNLGDHVTAGQRIGHINPDSNTNGHVDPHLHLSAWSRAYGQGRRVDPRSCWLCNAADPGPGAPVPPAPLSPNDFPLPQGYFFGPLDGPQNCVSGEYPGEPAPWRDALGRWQWALGLPVTKKWNDGRTPKAASVLQHQKLWKPTPNIGYGCIAQGEWDAVIKEGWRLPLGWDAPEPDRDSEAFPLPTGYFFGPLDGPDNCVSGEYSGEPPEWREALGRWQQALGLPVTKKWNDGKTPKAAEALQHQKMWKPTPGVGYGCICQGEWDAVFQEGWRLPAGWDSAGPKPGSKAFPLKSGYFYGPLDGPANSVSGEYSGEPQEWRDGLGRWQEALGLPVTKRWNDGKTRHAAVTLQLEKKLAPTPGIGYGCIGQAEWDAVIKDGWQLPTGWNPEKVGVPIDSALLWALVTPGGTARQREIIEQVGPALQSTLAEYKITTFLRVAHFVAQICHESDQFKTTVEYRDGTYLEGRTDLGNVNAGDGPKFKGRGLIQLTGRNNYREYGKALGIDLEADPGRAAEPLLSLKIACEYWKRNKINAMADADDVEAVTRAINGGLNGLADRKAYLARAKAVLGQFGCGGAPAPTPLPATGQQPRDVGSIERPGVTDVNDPDVKWQDWFNANAWKQSWQNPMLADNPPTYNGGPGPERDAAWSAYLAAFPLDARGVLPNPGAVGDTGLKLLGHAAAQLGTSYAWGGHGLEGPAQGTLAWDPPDGGAHIYRDDQRIGFDCSGLARYAAWQAGHQEIGMCTGDQIKSPALVDVVAGSMRPGDLVYYGHGDSHHVGIYVRPGVILNAPESGQPVQLNRRATGIGPNPDEGLIRARRLS